MKSINDGQKTDLVSEVITQLRKHTDAKYKRQCSRFYRGPAPDCLGVRTPVVRQIARQYFAKVKTQSKNEIFALCRTLLESGYSESKTVAFEWAYRVKNQYTPSDFRTVECWVKRQITHWSDCDDLCTHVVGELLFRFPELLPRLQPWRCSSNWCVRRAAAVSLIYPVRQARYLEEVLATAECLLLDPEDLVQKGYGWMLKAASEVFPGEVFQYVAARRASMPRTALRYAIEKFPESKRMALLAKSRSRAL